jgi:hypothetical protein
MDVRKLFLRFDPYLLLLLMLSLLALTPLLAPGYFYSAHDGRHSVFFVTMFDEAIRDGALWPRWAMHHSHGYGYPTFIIQAPLAFYVAEVFVLLGVGVTQAVKIAWGMGFLASAWGMYALVRYWLREHVGPREEQAASSGNHPELISLAGLVAGLLYVFAPYHLLDIYVRAAFAETMLMAWLPWVFLAFDRLMARGTARGWQGRLLLAALSYAGLLLTHVFALMAVTPLLVAFVLFRLWVEGRRGTLRWPRQDNAWASILRQVVLAAAGGIAALLLAAIFVLPLMVEGPLLAQEDYVRDTYQYERHWVHWSQLLSPFWGYGHSDDPVGANDGMGFQIGLILVLLAVVATYLLFANRWRERSLPLFLLLATAAILFVLTPAAAWFWHNLPFLSILQFPWRLLALASFLLSALGAMALWQVGRMSTLLQSAAGNGAGVLLMGLMVIFAARDYSHAQALQPIEPWREDGRAVFQFEQEHPDMFGYTNLVEERFTETPLTDQYRAEDFVNDRLERLGILAGTGEVMHHYSRGHSFGGELVMESPGIVQVRVLAFPGWQVLLDGEWVDYRVSPPHAVIELDVPAGRHRIDVRMGTTPVRTLGAAISVLTLLGLVGLWVYGRITWTRA